MLDKSVHVKPVFSFKVVDHLFLFLIQRTIYSAYLLYCLDYGPTCTLTQSVTFDSTVLHHLIDDEEPADADVTSGK